jgi:hypothetical protein
MLCDHVEKHVFTIKAQNEIKSFRGNSGVLPGSSVGNQLFSLGAWPAQASWASSRTAYAEHLWIVTEWNNDRVNPAVTTFVDDCGAVCTGASAVDAFLFDAKDDKLFDDAMAKVGLSQNAEKAVRQFALKGGMRSGITKMLRRSDGYINEKKFSETARYLGPHLHAVGHATPEVARRIAALQHNFMLRRCFLRSAAPFRIKGAGVQLCVLWRLGRRDVRFYFV